MTKSPRMTAALRKERLADVSAKRDDAMSIRSEDDTTSYRDNVVATEPVRTPPKTLPKVTLYAHGDVLKAIRRIAVDDGVQAQEILRRAVRDYLATRGHTFEDLTTGR